MASLYDLLIVGSGPAGLAAAVYAARARLAFAVLERQPMSGGQILNTYEVDNYPGLQGIPGFELGMKFREHAQKLGTDFIEDEIKKVIRVRDVFELTGESTVYAAKAIVLATGATHKKLGAPGEERLSGSGVSYCATCDGAFFRGKTVAVAGGGDVALEDAIFLSAMCKEVLIIHRRDEFRGTAVLAQQALSKSNVEVLWNSSLVSINGEEKVSSVDIKNVLTNEAARYILDGVFIAVGIEPNVGCLPEGLSVDASGYVIAGEDCVTNIPGVFVAGDLRNKPLRQVVTAVSDGANAVMSAYHYLRGFKV